MPLFVQCPQIFPDGYVIDVGGFQIAFRGTFLKVVEELLEISGIILDGMR